MTPEIVSLDNKRNLIGEKLSVVVLGATGMVGQQLITLLARHPWFKVVAVAASANSAGKSYEEAVSGRWAMDNKPPSNVSSMKVFDVQEIDGLAEIADVAFCALNLDKDEVLKLERAFAARGVWLTSNNSAYRLDPFVPMVIPAVNASHLDVVPFQRKAFGFTTGALIVKSNCSIQSYVIALDSLREFGIESVRVHSEQAISGAGKTFESFPEIERNLIPLIVGEEKKSEIEPLKIWGQMGADGISLAAGPKIKAKCVRVSVLHGHTAYVTVKFKSAPTLKQVRERWEKSTVEQLPSAPMKLIYYREEPDRPQPRLDVMTDGGMAVTIGQLKEEGDNSISFTALSHNLILGAAGGALLATEAAIARGLVYRRV